MSKSAFRDVETSFLDVATVSPFQELRIIKFAMQFLSNSKSDCPGEKIIARHSNSE